MGTFLALGEDGIKLHHLTLMLTLKGWDVSYSFLKLLCTVAMIADW